MAAKWVKFDTSETGAPKGVQTRKTHTMGSKTEKWGPNEHPAGSKAKDEGPKSPKGTETKTSGKPTHGNGEATRAKRSNDELQAIHGDPWRPHLGGARAARSHQHY